MNTRLNSFAALGALFLNLFALPALATTTITSVTGPSAGTYKTGQTLSFTVNFSAAVNVSGTPQLPLTIGATARNATYASGGGGASLVFSYTVQGTDLDMDGIASASPLALNGGTIKDGGNNNATLTFTPPGTTAVLVGLQRVKDAPMTLYARPGGISYIWKFGNGNNGSGPLTPLLDYEFDNVTAFGWNLTRGHVEYSSNGGASWTTMNSASPSFVTVAGTIWRYVDTTPGDSTTANNVGNHWHLVATPGSTTGTGGQAIPDNAPTDITADNSAFFSSASPGDSLATLTPTDTGDPLGGYWAIDSQSVSNLFTLTFDSTVGNKAILKLGTGTIPAGGQTPTVTVRYYDVFQTDASGLPIAGQGFSKTIGMTVVSEVSNDLTLGNDVPVNTYTPDSQNAPAAAKLSDGTLAVVWQSAGQGRSSTSYRSIHGQILSSTGTNVGGEFLAGNSGATVDDSLPAVTALAGGRWVVAYATSSGSAFSYVFRIIEANGTVGPEVSVATGISYAYPSAVATLTNGSFVVVWTDNNYAIRLHQYNAADGSSAAAEVVVVNGDGTTTGGYFPSVAALDNGSYAVAWVDGFNTYTVYAKAAGGGAVDTGFSPSGNTPPGIAGIAGGFVVVSDNYDSGTTRYQIGAARFDNTGTLQGGVFEANTVTAGNRYSPSVAPLSGGGFVVGWMADNGDYDSYGLFGRRYGTDGTPVDAGEFEINQHRLNAQMYPVLAPLANDRFAAVWTTVPTSSVADSSYIGDIYARVLLPVSAPAPTITGVTGPGPGSYRAGQSLNFTVTYSATVTVTGAPQLPLTIGGSSVNATYASGSGGAALTFTYTVQPGDADMDGIAAASPLVLNGGTIQDGSGTDAALTFTPPATTAVLVDTTSPTINVSAPSASSTSTGPVTYTVTYADAAFNASTLVPTNITLNATGTADGTVAVTATADPLVFTVTISGISGDGTLGITIAAGTASDLAGNTAPASDPSATVTVAKVTPSVTTWPAASAITYGQALSASTLSGGAASVAGSFAFTTPATTPAAGTASQSVTFTPNDSANYNTVAGLVDVTVARLDQTIAFPAIGNQIITNTLILDATASSGLPVTFAVASGPATLSGNTLNFTNRGVVSVVATQDGDANRNPAPTVTNTFSVLGLFQLTIASPLDFTQPASGTYTVIEGATLTNTASPAVIQGATQFVCQGWSAVGVTPSSSSDTNAVFTVGGDITLTWNWATNFWLAVSTNDAGLVDVQSAWFAAGSSVVITATSTGSLSFAQWTGDVSADQATNNPLTLEMSGPKSVKANFSAPAAIAFNGWVYGTNYVDVQVTNRETSVVSVLRVYDIVGNSWQLTGPAGHFYDIQTITQLGTSAPWENLPFGTNLSAFPAFIWTDSYINATNQARFYRLKERFE